jgi:hypothetical protein
MPPRPISSMSSYRPATTELLIGTNMAGSELGSIDGRLPRSKRIGHRTVMALSLRRIESSHAGFLDGNDGHREHPAAAAL